MTTPNRQLSPSLFDEPEQAVGALTSLSGSRAIEDEAFPFEALSDVCEIESWRKEINRPLYHIHKWWAHRLGTAFRGIVLSTFAPSGVDVMGLFYQRMRINGSVVFDPFMGSGTTVGEALKLGARVIGRDINPVAHFLVRNALTLHDRDAVIATFREIERDVAHQIYPYYRCRLSDGRHADVLYYFWVKTIACPSCSRQVDLFSSHVFARHAYPKRSPGAQSLCPRCGAINSVRFDARSVCCVSCGESYDPQRGPARGQTATCPDCEHVFPIAKTVRAGNSPPSHRLYAKLVLLRDGSKQYVRATDEDHALYEAAEHALREKENPHPVVAIAPGYNTNQVLGYNYRFWHQMFNARQLLGLSILADRIRVIPDPRVRDLFVCLLSGTLEFNNMFASYKGEGTGAVRHMFAHHILKPERMPLEANLWGTPKSSGSFSTIFEGRICRALDYAENPFEIRASGSREKKTGEKVFDLSERVGFDIADSYAEFAGGMKVYLSCGDSRETDIPDASIDAVITDPPFFDNVHYSQLADFFHVWQQHVLLDSRAAGKESTRSSDEVQNEDVGVFTRRLAGVWTEACRVLKNDGLLVFTYHHSRPDGWRSILDAIMSAGFTITASHPIKAEMSVAMPKHQAKEPIDLDIIVVCRKTSFRNADSTRRSWSTAALTATSQVHRLRHAGRKLSRNDVRVVVTAQVLRYLSSTGDVSIAITELDKRQGEIEELIDRLYASSAVYGGECRGDSLQTEALTQVRLGEPKVSAEGD
ncbi:MAG: DNA methyltransferase [Vicinamibacterales bacterium]